MADCAIEIWPRICKVVKFWEKLPPSKRPKSESFLNVQEAVKDSLKSLKLYFFSFIASLMEPYLRAYQTDKPMIPFMCNDLEKLSKNLLKLFIKPEVIDKCTSPNQLKEIDVRKKENLLKKKKLKIVFPGRNKTFVVV